MQLGKDFKKVLKQIEEEKGLSEEIIVASLEDEIYNSAGDKRRNKYADYKDLYTLFHVVLR